MKKLTLIIFLIGYLNYAQGVIWEEDFESNSIPSDWTTLNVSGGNGNNDWTFGTGNFPWTDTNSWNMDNNAAIFSDYTADETSHDNRMLLRTEGVDATGYTNLKVKMEISLRTSGSTAGVYGGALYVLIYDAGSSSWYNLAYYDSNLIDVSNVEINLQAFLDAHPTIDQTDIRIGFRYDDLGHGITYGAGIGWVKITGNPSNDNCSNAVTVVIPDETEVNLTNQHLRGTTSNNGGIDACQNNQIDGIWYTFTPTHSWDMFVRIPDDIYWYPPNELKVEIYTGSCSNFNCITGNYYNNGRKYRFSVNAGTQYWVNISRYNITDYSQDISSFELIFGYERPENDSRENRYVIDDLPYTNTQSLNATTNNDDTTTNGFVTVCAPGMNDGVWYILYATADAEINIEAQASQVDLEIGLYELTDPLEFLDFNNYSCAGNVDSTLTGGLETLTTQIQVGKHYMINIGDYSAYTNHQEEGDLTINVYYSEPVNNDCQNAIELVNNQALQGSNVGATSDFTNTCDNTTNDVGVWYHYVSQYGGIVTLFIDNSTNGNYNENLTVLTGDCNNLTCEFNINDNNPYAEFETQIGEDYYIYVATDNQHLTSFTITANNVPPQNDEATGAIEIPVNSIGTTCTSPTEVWNANGVTDSSPINGTPSCASYAGGDSWYKFIAPTSGGILINRPNTGDWGGFGYAIYDSPTSNTPLTCNFMADSNTVTESNPFTGLTPGNYYWLRVWEWNNNDYGSVGICLTEVETAGYDDYAQNEVSLYPNPVKDKLYITSENQIKNIKIYDMLGRLAVEENPLLNEVEINLNNLTAGNYVVKIQINNRNLNYKIIKL
ncbi:MAG TPA: T9SS type A sorting domain-containing protein [Flavobacteriia bacterium]|nr:T9SS type A sorting domain-containing protein [Flavobacteriia bacterium]